MLVDEFDANVAQRMTSRCAASLPVLIVGCSLGVYLQDAVFEKNNLCVPLLVGLLGSGVVLFRSTTAWLLLGLVSARKEWLSRAGFS